MLCQHVKDYHPHYLAPYPSLRGLVLMVPADLSLVASQSDLFFQLYTVRQVARLFIVFTQPQIASPLCGFGVFHRTLPSC
jgi:hypothetical protein